MPKIRCDIEENEAAARLAQCGEGSRDEREHLRATFAAIDDVTRDGRSDEMAHGTVDREGLIERQRQFVPEPAASTLELDMKIRVGRKFRHRARWHLRKRGAIRWRGRCCNG